MGVKVNCKGGGSFVSLRPVFSEDGEQLYVVWKNSILRYGSKTGKLIHEYKGFADDIVGFSINNYQGFEVLTACSNTGKIIVWKTTTNFKIFNLKINKKVNTFNVLKPTDSAGFVALISYKKPKSTMFAMYNLENRDTKDFSFELEGKKEYKLDVSASGYFSVVSEQTIHFISHDFKTFASKSIGNKRTFTCVACHPTEEIVLAGDSTGRIIAYQEIFSKRNPEAIYHWHTLPVACLNFSTSGSYFYSGGGECVLVKWELNNPNQKYFVPRIVSEIKQITVSENNIFTAVSSQDNGIRIYDTRLQQIALIQHLVLGERYDCGIIYDPHSKGLVMNGYIGHVQFYSPSDRSLMYNLDIVGQNKITNERNKTMINTDVTKLAMSKSGLWLGTVEERKDLEYQYEIRLKFWKFNQTNQMFELNTSVEYPHDTSISNLMFQPLENESNFRCVTVGTDKKFKLWQLAESGWKCYGVGFYRNLNCQGLSFSSDGSLVATGFERNLTAWQPDSCELKCSLVHPSFTEDVTHVEFGYGNQCHLLVAASKVQLGVWNILSLSMIWTVPLKVSLLVADLFSIHMAVITRDSKVFVFKPDSSEPIYSSNELIKNHRVSAATFIPSKNSHDSRLQWFERTHFYFIDDQNDLYSIETDEEVHYDTKGLDDSISTPFNAILPVVKSSAVKVKSPTRHLYEKDSGHKSIKKYLDAPLHTMIPVRFACNALLKSLVLQKEVL